MDEQIEWPGEELRQRFNQPENELLLRYLEKHSPHAHSDLGILILETRNRFEGVGVYGPNITACSYLFAHTQAGVAFALAVGMTSLVLRLPERHPETVPFEKIGPGWCEFNPFDPTRLNKLSADLVRELTASAFRHAGAARRRAR